MEKQITSNSLSPKILLTIYNFWKSKTKGFNLAQLIVLGAMFTFFVVALVGFVTQFVSELQ